MRHFLPLILLFLTVLSVHAIGIGTWNNENNPDNVTEDANFNAILPLLGEFAVLGLNETDTGSSVRFRDLVNAYHTTFGYSVLTSDSVGGDRVGILYDIRQVQLIEAVQLEHEDLTRPALRALFRPLGSAGSMDFYFYSVHLKSGTSLSDQTVRAEEAAILRADIASLPSPYAILAGDLNMQRASQTAWGVLTSSGRNAMQDLAHAVGSWKDNSDYSHLHTQDPGASMDDRFDIILGSAALQDSFQLDIRPDSYNVIGNDGSHTLNSDLSTGTSATPAQIAALMAASDHLPVMVDLIYIPQVSLSNITDTSVTLSWTGLTQTHYDIYATPALNSTVAPNYPAPTSAPIDDEAYALNWGRIATHSSGYFTTESTATVSWDSTLPRPHFWSLVY